MSKYAATFYIFNGAKEFKNSLGELPRFFLFYIYIIPKIFEKVKWVSD